MKCNNCGNEIPDMTHFCPFCGSQQSLQNYQNEQSNQQFGQDAQFNQNAQFNQQFGQQPYVQQPYAQQPFAQQQFGQQSFAQQPFAQQQFGQQQFAQQNTPGSEYNPYIPSPDSVPYFQQGYTSPDQRPKKKKGKIIAIIISCVVLLAGLGVGAYFLFFNKTLSPTDVVEKYLDAMIDCDMSKASEYFLPKTNEYHQKVFDSAMELKKHYITLSYSDVKEDGNLTAAETEKLNYSLNELYNISCTKFVFVSLTLSSDHSKDETESGRLIVGQYDDKWYVICSEDTPIEVIPPQEVADRFMEAFESLDVQKMLKQIHVSMKNSSTFDDLSSIEELGKMGIKLSVSGGKEISMSDSDIGSYKEELLDKHGLAVDDVKTFDYTITLSFMGQSNPSDLKLIIGKIDGKWYVIDTDYE